MKATGGVAALASASGLASGRDDGSTVDVQGHLDDLTLREKAGQMTQITLDSLDPAELPDVFADPGVGSVLSGGAEPPTFDPAELVAGVNDLQEHAMETTDHGVPFVYGIDAVHGNATVEGATVFPHNLGLGATRNVDAVRAVAGVTGRSVESIGAHWTFSPTADVQRDARWGRFYEGFSEDSYLTGIMSRAKVAGYEETGQTGSCVKHFAGYSVPENGSDRHPANTSMRDLRENVLPPYEMALGGDPETVMVNSGSVNGVPAHASTWLLTRVLRERWGYEGMVVSDWQDFLRMVELHEYVPTLREATKRGIEAGVDMYMNPEEPGAFVDMVVDLVESGDLDEARVDEAVGRILRFKANLGLFEDPYADESAHEDAVGAGQSVASSVTEQTMTLLKNDDALPLDEDPGTLLLTGPATDSTSMQMGGWTLGWQGLGNESEMAAAPRATTIFEAMQEAVASSSSLVHEQTGYDFSTWWEGTEFFFDDEEAVRSAAADADAVVLALGEVPHSEGVGDRTDLALPEPQRRLVAAVSDAAPADTPLVGVLYAGSPLGNAETFDHLDGVLMAYQPGTEGGPAVADALFGASNPSGRLPFTWPTSVGQSPNYYDAWPPAQENEPLYPFGHGLSYTDFEYDDLTVSPASVADVAEQGHVTAEVTVTNAGDRAGDHVIDAYATESYGSVIHPNRRLVGSDRVSLEPGESERVAVQVPLITLEVVPGDVPGVRERTVEASDYTLAVGEQTATLTVTEDGSVSRGGPMASLADVNEDGRVDGRDLRELLGVLRGNRDEDDGSGWQGDDVHPGRGPDGDGPPGHRRDDDGHPGKGHGRDD